MTYQELPLHSIILYLRTYYLAVLRVQYGVTVLTDRLPLHVYCRHCFYLMELLRFTTKSCAYNHSFHFAEFPPLLLLLLLLLFLLV